MAGVTWSESKMVFKRSFWSLFVLFSLFLLVFAGCPARLSASMPIQSSPPETIPVQSTVEPPDEIEERLSPDGQWEAILNKTTGSLDLIGKHNESFSIFPAGSGVTSINWSPDSSRLLIVRPYYLFEQKQGTLLNAAQPIEIWQIRPLERQAAPATLLFRASREEFERDGAQQVVFGHWSPNSRYVVMWLGMLSASILADGLPPLVLDTDTGNACPIAVDSSADPITDELSAENVALVNPRYHSWSPDSSRLAITAGGYRSAQINKWLNLVEANTGQVMTVISQAEQIPGIVAWSPRGDMIAYAAVPADQTGEEWADWMVFENPAIAGRRVYLLDPATGHYHRLNEVESYQDAPVWSSDGGLLYYVQRNGGELCLMVADPTTGQADPVPGVQQPIGLGDPARPTVGYYGQFGRQELLEQIPEKPLGATAVGRVIERYAPVPDLPLWVGDEPVEQIKRRTDAQGRFTLTGLQPGLIRVRNSHLEFEVPVTSLDDMIDLGLLKYPLFHPPPYYWWTAAPLSDSSILLNRGQDIDFTICHTEPAWQRPTEQEQRDKVWSKRPFNNRPEEWLKSWFERQAVIYNGESLFEQSYPDGPNLDNLTADWRYLLGLWTDANFKFDLGFESIGLFVPRTNCSYDAQSLDDLYSRRQLEIWLLHYRATRVQRLDKTLTGYNQTEQCDESERAFDERPGYHFAIHVEPSPGYQIIRFAGEEDALAVHLFDENDRELAISADIY